MKLTVELGKAECIKDTRGIGKDEPYLAFFLSTVDKDKKEALYEIAPCKVNEHITDGSVFYPIFKDDKRIHVFDMSGLPTNNVFALTIVLYEQDNAAHYKALHKNAANRITPVISKFDKSIAVDLVDALKSKPVNVTQLLTSLYKLGRYVVCLINADDLIDKYVFVQDNENNINGDYKIPFRGCGGEYNINISLKVEK